MATAKIKTRGFQTVVRKATGDIKTAMSIICTVYGTNRSCMSTVKLLVSVYVEAEKRRKGGVGKGGEENRGGRQKDNHLSV